MNKKLLFAALSLAAFTACTDDNFESQKQLAEQTCPVEFELVNSSDATRASMGTKNYNNIEWTSDDHDLFTLYHGSVAPANVQDFDFKSGYENATYESSSDGTTAKLTTPTMIKQGRAIMVWPCDTTFRIKPDDALTIKIPAEQNPSENPRTGKKTLANIIPYVSDLVNIAEYAEYSETADPRTDYNTAGYARKYPVYMRPMASQLNLKPNYIGQEAIDELKNLEEDPIEDITIDNIQLLTDPDGDDMFTTEIPLQFAAPAANQGGNWALVANHRAWDKVTAFDKEHIVAKTATLTSTCFHSDYGICKFLFLPQANIGQGVDNAAIIVNTYYGQVVVARGDDVYGFKGRYEEGELNNAWYRFVSAIPVVENEGETTSHSLETTPDNEQKYRCSAAPAFGMQQTINVFSNYTVETQNHTSVVENEQQGIAYTRYLNVYLKYLDMKNLHIKTDKQLYDVVRVWDALNLGPVTVYLDGGHTEGFADDEFVISQKTIKKINEINAANAGEADDALPFKVKPCGIADHKNCAKIVVTGSDQEQNIQNVAFIAKNDMGTADNADDDVVADVVFAEEDSDTPWIWNGTVKVTATGVGKFVNLGYLKSVGTAEGAVLATYENDGETQNNVNLWNKGTWDVTGGVIFVQFGVRNYKTLNIAKNAQYRQQGIEASTIFRNMALAIPGEFEGGNDDLIGVVNNLGVFAATNNGKIYNYGLIEHADKDAKTYITRNQTNADFEVGFNTNNNMMGRINLPYSNKEENNISISATLDKGFVSVTVADGDNLGNTEKALNVTAVGDKVNYVIIKGGVQTIKQLPAQIKYVEIWDQSEPATEIAWDLTDLEDHTATYDGLMVLTPVNIQINTTIIVTKACYLGADMYVGGVFKKAANNAALPSWNGYFGDTTGAFATKYVTYD